MFSMLNLWAGGPRIDTQSGAINDNHYFNGLRHINVTWWTKLALSVVLFDSHMGDETVRGACP